MGWAVIFFSLLFLSSLLSADEVDRFLEEVRPPARFANHVPNFSATQERFTFDSNAGLMERPFILWNKQDIAGARKKVETESFNS